MASPLESPRSQSPPLENPGMESRTNSDWELLSMSQVDVSGSQDSGSSTPKVASQSTIDKPQEASHHQERGQLDDSFFNALGVEGFLQADRGARRGGGFESLLPTPQVEGAWPHLSWSQAGQAGESGVLVAPHTLQIQHHPRPDNYLQRSKASLTEGDALVEDAEAGDNVGKGSGIGLDISQQRDVEPQAEKEKEGQRYADSPVSPLTGPASFGAGTSYASSLGTPPVTPPSEERMHLGSWMGVPDNPPVKESEAPESELDWGSIKEETQEEEPPQAPLMGTAEVVSQPASSVATVAGPENEEGEKEPPTALQKWFPYEAWWQKQETLRRWVKSVLSQPLTVWSLGLTTAVLGILFLHQLWRNRDLQVQLRAGNKRLADQEETIRRLREAMSFRRRVPVLRVPVRFTATTWS